MAVTVGLCKQTGRTESGLSACFTLLFAAATKAARRQAGTVSKVEDGVVPLSFENELQERAVTDKMPLTDAAHGERVLHTTLGLDKGRRHRVAPESFAEECTLKTRRLSARPGNLAVFRGVFYGSDRLLICRRPCTNFRQRLEVSWPIR